VEIQELGSGTWNLLALLDWAGLKIFCELRKKQEHLICFIFCDSDFNALKIRSQVSLTRFRKKNRVLLVRTILIFHLHDKSVAIFIPSCSPSLLSLHLFADSYVITANLMLEMLLYLYCRYSFHLHAISMYSRLSF